MKQPQARPGGDLMAHGHFADGWPMMNSDVPVTAELAFDRRAWVTENTP